MSFFSCINVEVKRIDEEQKQLCDQDITLKEINLCISKLKDNKSPGNDGLTSEFYKKVKEDVSEFLLNVYREALSKGRLPPSMSQGLITLIPKSGKDSTSVENWRPITLINDDAKLLSLLFTQRLKPCLQTIVDDRQYGFINSRQISNNVRLKVFSAIFLIF